VPGDGVEDHIELGQLTGVRGGVVQSRPGAELSYSIEVLCSHEGGGVRALGDRDLTLLKSLTLSGS